MYILQLIILQLQGLQYHLDIIKSEEDLNNYNWKDLDEWMITEFFFFLKEVVLVGMLKAGLLLALLLPW